MVKLNEFDVDGLLARVTKDGPRKTIKRSRSGGLPRLQYHPGRVLHLGDYQDVEVRVPGTHLSSRNDGLRRRLVWGAREYTPESDVVAMLVHDGIVALPRSRSPTHPFASLLVTFNTRIDEGVIFGKDRNGLKSRASIWHKGPRVSIRKVIALNEHGDEVPLPPHVPPAEPTPPFRATFSLSNLPALVYCLHAVADRGTDRAYWPSKRLAREVLYVESARRRYEVTKAEPPERVQRRDDGKKKGLYVRFAEVKTEVIQAEFLGSVPKPAPLNDSDVFNAQVVKWSALKWGVDGLTVLGVHYPLMRVTFRAKVDESTQDDAADKTKQSESKSL